MFPISGFLLRQKGTSPFKLGVLGKGHQGGHHGGSGPNGPRKKVQKVGGASAVGEVSGVRRGMLGRYSSGVGPWAGQSGGGALTLLASLARKARLTHTAWPQGGRGLAVTVEALQPPTWVGGGPSLVAQGTQVSILALAAVGKGIEGHTLPMDTPARIEKKHHEGKRPLCKLSP